jgi:hypothetical protein
MKKLAIALLAITFSTVSAQAATIGVKLSSANMEAAGSHTTNSSSGGSGGAAVNQSNDADFQIGSIFIESDNIELGPMNMSLGLDVIPFTTEVDKLGGGNGLDATVEVGNLVTAYIQPTFNPGADVSIFAKLGYAQADLDITDITRQATEAGTASTDGNQGKSLDGIMYGLGIQKSVSNGLFDFLRLEGTITDFDEISHTNSNGKIVKADAELLLISLSIGKTF